MYDLGINGTNNLALLKLLIGDLDAIIFFFVILSKHKNPLFFKEMKAR